MLNVGDANALHGLVEGKILGGTVSCLPNSTFGSQNNKFFSKPAQKRSLTFSLAAHNWLWPCCRDPACHNTCNKGYAWVAQGFLDQDGTSTFHPRFSL